jgi:transcriptional regulator with XRE-family HTH domain
MTQQELASAIGVSVGAVRHWEKRGNAPKRPSVKLALCRRLDMTVGELLFGDAMPGDDSAIVLRFSPALMAHVDALLTTGLWGQDRAAVVERLACQTLRSLL